MKLSGIITAAITPLSVDGSSLASQEAFDKYYQFLLDRKINGLFVCGTTGEGMVLNLEERKQVAERATGIIAHQIPVMVHVGCNSTPDTLELALHAAQIGADGIVIITPYFYTYDSLALARHFRTVAEAVPDLPVYLYYLPSMAHNDISVSLLAEMKRSCPNIHGLKHSDDDQVRLQEFRQVVGQDFCILSGDDSVALAALSLGADGCVTGKSSAFPEMMVAIYQTFCAGDLPKARLLQSNLNRLLGGLLDIGQGIGLAYFKAALVYRGIYAGGMRAPQRSLTPQEEAQLVAGLERLRGYAEPPGSWTFPNEIPLPGGAGQ